MGNRIRHNLVTFSPQMPGSNAFGPRIRLDLGGPFKVTAGLAPDVNSATVSYKEFDRLGSLASQPGKIEFWYTTLPPGDGGGAGGAADVQRNGYRICEIRPQRIGVPKDLTARKTRFTTPGSAPPRVLVYELFFEDARHGFVFPRGGRLRSGVVNFGESAAAAQAAGTNTEMDTFELVQACLSAMGVGADIPASVANIPPPRNVNWFNAHAPTELGKLLELCGLAFCPQADATFTLKQITTTGQPQIGNLDEVLPAIQIPALRREGKSVIVVSSEPVIETQTLEGPRDDQWYFVCQDSTDQWVRYDDCDLLDNADAFDEGGMLANYMDAFTRIDPPQFQERLAQQAYRYLKLGDGTGATPPGQTDGGLRAAAPVLAHRLDRTGARLAVRVLAKRMTRDGLTAVWDNSPGPILCTAHFAIDSGILWVQETLLQVKSKTLYPHLVVKELQPGDIQITFASHQYEKGPPDQDGASDWIPVHYSKGFQEVNGDTVALSDDQTALLLENPTPDTVVLERPDFVPFVVDDNPINKVELDTKARFLAISALAGSGEPVSITQVLGFASVTLDGLVSSVEWDQQSMRTSVIANNWQRPLGANPQPFGNKIATGIGGGGGGSNFPGDGSGIGGGGGGAGGGRSVSEAAQSARQKNTALNPSPIVLPIERPIVVCKLTGVFAGGGYYEGTVYGGAPGTDGSQDLSLPGGMTPGDVVLLFNLDEDGLQTNRVAVPSYVEAVFTGPSTEDTPRPMLAFHGGVGNQDGPKILGGGTGTDPDLGTWNRDSDVQDGGAVIPFATREIWDSAADGGAGQLKEFTRTMTVDARGMIIAVSYESERVVLTGVPGCT